MKKFITLLALTLCFMGTAQAEMKIAVVDQMAAVMNSEPAKVIVEQIRAKLEKEQAKGMAIQKDLEGLNEKYERDGAIMSESEMRKLKQEVEDKQMEAQYVAQRVRKRQKEGEEEILKAIGPKFRKAITDLMEEGGYAMILQRQAAIEIATSIDITEKVTAKINEQK